MAKKYNYNFIRKHSQGGGTAVRLAILSGGLFVVDAVISFAFEARQAFMQAPLLCLPC